MLNYGKYWNERAVNRTMTTLSAIAVKKRRRNGLFSFNRKEVYTIELTSGMVF